MKKLLILIFSLFFLSSPSVFAEFGDTYNCKTIQISVITENEATTNYNPITFSFSMQNDNLDTESYIGTMTFDQNVIGSLVANPLGDYLFMDTHVKPERVMASLGTTTAWFDDGDLSISSMYKDDDYKVVRVISSMSKCNKI